MLLQQQTNNSSPSLRTRPVRELLCGHLCVIIHQAGWEFQWRAAAAKQRCPSARQVGFIFEPLLLLRGQIARGDWLSPGLCNRYHLNH